MLPMVDQSQAVLCLGVVRKEPLPAFLLGHNDVHNRLSSVLEGLEFDFDVGWEEHLGVPGKALACRYVGDLSETMVSGVTRRTLYFMVQVGDKDALGEAGLLGRRC